MPRSRGLTYAQAGVDRPAVGRSLRALLGAIRGRPRPGHGTPVGPAGHFAGLIRVGRETIAATTDTVGTKVRIAEALGRWVEVGEDMVAINVNDLAAIGARPFGFVDTISCATPDPSVFRALGRGLDRGLRAGRCSLLGGETAIVPSLVRGYDLGGTALGFFPNGRRPITGEAIRAGDRLLGVPASGLHANGFTLVHRIVRRSGRSLRAARPGGGESLGRELLRPTRSYVPVSEALGGIAGVHGFAHLSGGGVRNLVRLTPTAGFELDAWPEPAGIFGWLQRAGAVTDHEMFQTFNMGVGFVAVVSPSAATAALAALRRSGVRDATWIGRVTSTPGVRLPARGLEYRAYA